MVKVNELKFGADGLIPAVVTDFYSKKTLTVAYMNRESLEISMREGKTCFYSRSRQKLWRKGETSGNYQHIVSIKTDCDRDALAVEVIKDGPACHLGTDGCFNDQVYASDGLPEFSLTSLYELISARKTQKVEGSYTNYLFDSGLDKILKKVGEESAEVLIAGKGGEKAETVFEICDLIYHLLVLMAASGITPVDIVDELKTRHVIDKKVKQQKMK